MDAELGQQPAPDEGADDSDDEIADDPEPGALHDLTGQPPGNQADEQYDEKAFARHVHFVPFRIRPDSRTNPLPQDTKALPTKIASQRSFPSTRTATPLSG